MEKFQELLAKAAAAHGHMCPGQVLGVRLGLVGLGLLGLDAPLNDRDIKKVLVYVEIDRCMADALVTVTGVKLGRRSLKFKDLGLMAATFLHLPDGRAFRLAVREDCRSRAATLYPEITDSYQREVLAYQVMPAGDLFAVTQVRVEVKAEDLPGTSVPKATCDRCHAVVRHGRGVARDGLILCPVCAGQGYFETIGPVEGWEARDPLGA